MSRRKEPQLPAGHPMHELRAKGEQRLRDPFAEAREGHEAEVRAACALFAYHRDMGLPVADGLLQLVTDWLRRIGQGEPFAEAFVGKRKRGARAKATEREMHEAAMIGYHVATEKERCGSLEEATAEIAERYGIGERTARAHYERWMLGKLGGK